MAEKEKKKAPESACNKKDRPFFYGGQAVLEGVMMMGKTSVALAVREESGAIVLERQRRAGPKHPIWYKIPIIRGVLNFVLSMVTGMKMLTKSAEALGEEDEKLGKGAIGFAVLLGLVFFVALFILLPSLAVGAVERWLGVTSVVYLNLIESGLRILIFIAYLLLITLMKDIRRTFMYHGAEHKTINCFERGEEMTIENIEKQSTRNNRCGTTFLFFVIIISIIVFSLVTYVLNLLGITQATTGSVGYPFIKVGIRLLLLPLVAGLSYELLKLLARGSDRNILLKVLRAPGLALQGLTTRQPDREMIEVALTAFNAAKEMDDDPSAPELKFDLSADFQKQYTRISGDAVAKGVDTASVDFLICDVLGVPRAELAALKFIRKSQSEQIENLSYRLLKREPLQYILGHTEFFGVKILTDKRALIPRLDSERLCELCAGELGARENPLTLLDMCCGTGALGLSIAAATGAKPTIVDISADALALAGENSAALGIDAEIIRADFFEGVTGTFDAVVCNPPYVKSGDMDALAPEVKAEPALALDGGADGLDFYRRAAKEIGRFLKAGAAAWLELGDGQDAEVREIFSAYETEVLTDLSGNARILKVTREQKTKAGFIEK